MKFTLDADASSHQIGGYREGAVRIGGEEYTHSLIVTPQTLLDWPVVSAGDLTLEHLAEVLRLEPEIIVLGTGARQVFPPLPVQAALSGRGIGLETMDTGAACRTYNVLMSEGRRVAAALVITPPD